MLGGSDGISLAGAPPGLEAGPISPPPLDEAVKAPAPQSVTAAPPAPAVSLAALQRAGLTHANDRRGRQVLEQLGLIHHQVVRCIDEARAEPEARRRVVLVASALRQEGRSFIALNIAAGIASNNARPVLLVDADGRAGGMTSLLGLTERTGLRDMVAVPGMAADSVIVPTGVRRLSFVPHGAVNRRDAPAGSTMAHAILRLAAALPQHVIIIDPPSCLSSSDCSALAAASGQVVLVVDAQRTRTDEVEAALDVLDACPISRLLLNRMRLDSPDTYGAQSDTYGAQSGDGLTNAA